MRDKPTLRSNSNLRTSYEMNPSPKYEGRVQLIFLNPDETYYYKGLSELDTDAFLWLYFHDNNKFKFECVYFLKYSQNRITLSDFGDQLGKRFVRERKSLRIAEKSDSDIERIFSAKEFKSDVFPELNKASSAIIVSIDDLFEMMTVKELSSLFFTSKNRKGMAKIIILVTHEDAMLLRDKALLPFLTDKIRDLVYQHRVTDGIVLRDTLYNEEVDNCIFLDRITSEDAKNIVRDVMLSNRERINTPADFQCMTDFLAIVTDEDVPEYKDYDRKKSRKACHEYISSVNGWLDLTDNCSRVSREYLMLPDITDEFMNYTNFLTGRELRFDVEAYRERISDNRDRKEPCVYYSLMKLCNEFHSSDIDNGFYTRGIIISALKVISEFIDPFKELSLSNKRFIANDLLGSYLDCINKSRSIERAKRFSKRNKEDFTEEITPEERSLITTLRKLQNDAISIFKQPSSRPRFELDVREINIQFKA